ncbi:DUF1877 family protein [Streptomyces sp. NBC_01268]|uniref:DUF1877 family protein n=1 Tax=unclassified Streptomyces TaxID=2593676 RepID=UPI002E370C19|nr:DUF1877 family protein [Streptomyces sp. NBC_01268]
MHLRAAAMSEILDDHAWLEAFMSRAWEHHQVECAAGVADSIEKDFGLVHELYAASTDVAGWLPVFGGRQPAGAPGDAVPDPPLLLLEPAEVRAAAAFLADVPFDELWEVTGAKILASFGPGWAEALVLEIFRGHHRDLRAFYGRAAAAGHTVVKAGWF